MTLRDYTANVISATKVVPDGNFKDSKASGVWDINEALDLIKGGNWPNAANFNPASFVDGLFQTNIWNGTGSEQTITNDIDLSNQGGLVWIKLRTTTTGFSFDNHLFDTERGALKRIRSNRTNAESNYSNSLTSFNSNGFTLGSDSSSGNVNYGTGTNTYVSWTFRKQPKFFDIQTYTGSGESGQTISHNLGVAPGMVIVKDTSTTGSWYVYHRSLGSGEHLKLNSTNAVSTDSNYEIGKTTASATQFSIDTGSEIDYSGNTYVAYFFAHNNDDGGFGEPGDQDIIKCDKIDSTSDDIVNVTLGFEPQFIMIKKSSTTGDWQIFDNTRGMPHGEDDQVLAWNTNGAESGSNRIKINPDGFTASGFGTNTDYIYMAIRRGGMQTPSTPSTVFNIGTVQTDTFRTLTNSLTGKKLSPDFVLYRTTGDGANWFAQTRLMGNDTLFPNRDVAANTSTYGNSWGKVMQNVAADGITSTGTSSFGWMWARARGYFDVVAYTGTGSATTVKHNLGVVPEMIWVKDRDATENWPVYHKGLDGGTNPETHYIRLNQNNAEADSADWWNDTAPTASVFSVGTQGQVNTNGNKYIAYLFATVAGVTKLGSYTGNDGTTNVDCGFTNGARFVLIKKMNGTGDWVVLDSERGIVDGNTPYLRLNTTDAQDNLGARDIIDPLASGFTINANMGGVNDSGDTFLFYAIAADPS